jgi:hypothetical protein
MFCVECGTFIAIGEKAFSGRTAGTTATGDEADAAPMSLGAYSAAVRRRAERRRTRLALVSAGLVAVVGLASIYVATAPGRRDGEAAMLALPTSAAASPHATTSVPSGMALAEGIVELDLAGLEEPVAVPGAGSAVPAEATAAPASVPQAASAVAAATAVTVPATSAPAKEVPARVRPMTEPQATPAVTPSAAASVVWRDGWVCDGTLQLDDSRARDWTITGATFQPGNGYERVILRLNRFGSGSGSPASLSAESFATARVQREVTGVRQPSAGRTTLALEFADGVKTDVSLRGYRPSGLRSIKEFSAYPAGRGGSRVLISSAGSGCFRVRTPAWSGAGGTAQGQIIIDIKS